MSTNENIGKTKRLFEEAFNKKNSAVVDEIVAKDYVDHSAIPAPVPGSEGFKKRVEMLRAGLNPTIAFGEFVAEGELVAFNWTMTGKHEGPFAGVQATGKPVTLGGINIERFKDGMLVEHWSQFDMAGVLRQIGALPAPK
jgi:steroid delta-isomerase-like uncharacterized protein